MAADLSNRELEDNRVDNRIVLSLLESVERDGAKSQRRLASEIGIALGLVNAYVRRCARKGLLKVAAAPARRYAYYLTPQGFAEKSRLTFEYMSYSLGLFRRAKADFAAVFEQARARGVHRIALAGVSDLAEIAAICALETGIAIVAVVDPRASVATHVGVPVVASWDELEEAVQGVVVTDMSGSAEAWAAAVARFGPERVLLPELLRSSIPARTETVP